MEPSRDEETDFLEFHLVRLMLAGTFLLDIRHLALDFCALAMNAFAVVLLAIVLLLFVQNRICKQLNRGDHMALRVVLRHGHTGCCGT